MRSYDFETSPGEAQIRATLPQWKITELSAHNLIATKQR
jgi:hypothetical protein